MKSFVPFFVLAAGLVMATTLSTTQKPTRTVGDLQDAYRAGSSDQALFAAYARDADREGYHSVASLFLAVSAGEGVDAENDLQALQDIGAGRPQVASEPSRAAGATRQDLADALRPETLRCAKLTPRMLADVRSENQPGAQLAFTYALHAQKQRAALLASALASLGGQKTPTAYYVSPVCGGIYAGRPPAVCPVCGLPARRFEAFEWSGAPARPFLSWSAAGRAAMQVD